MPMGSLASSGASGTALAFGKFGYWPSSCCVCFPLKLHCHFYYCSSKIQSCRVDFNLFFPSSTVSHRLRCSTGGGQHAKAWIGETTAGPAIPNFYYSIHSPCSTDTPSPTPQPQPTSPSTMSPYCPRTQTTDPVSQGKSHTK